ncbi:hypothetical protein ACFLYF_03950 [Chloroflexota bacterium]
MARYDFWIKAILGGVLGILLFSGIALLPVDTEGALVMFGATLFDALLFHAILPRRFQIFPDRLRIVLGQPFAINLALSNIAEARLSSGNKVFAYWGIRFATSTRCIVEIVRKRGLNLVISPTNCDTFREQLNQTLAD